MRKPSIKIGVRADNYAALQSLSDKVIQSLTGNLSFPAPSPPVAVLQAAADDLTAAIAAWGPAGMRGARKELFHLRSTAIHMRNLLLKEAAYVMNLVDLSASPEEQARFITSSGFTAKESRNLQGVLEAVRNFHQVISPRLNGWEVKLRWEKPLNVVVNSNVKSYLVFRSETGSFSDAEFLDAVTRTTFTDYNPIRGATNTYFIIAINNAGRGAISVAVSVNVF